MAAPNNTVTMKFGYEVVIRGARHTGLVAAAYLAAQVWSILLLEKNDYIRGATDIAESVS
jgi:phytoene dehydrogenase-like protein